jgi:hypothetical protein
LIIAIAALCAILFIPFLPQGDPMMGRGFQGKVAIDETGRLEQVTECSDTTGPAGNGTPPVAATYLETLSCPRTGLLCMTGLFFQYVGIIIEHTMYFIMYYFLIFFFHGIALPMQMSYLFWVN